jgi:hypothetical protein
MTQEWARTADDVLWRRSKLGVPLTRGEAVASHGSWRMPAPRHRRIRSDAPQEPRDQPPPRHRPGTTSSGATVFRADYTVAAHRPAGRFPRRNRQSSNSNTQIAAPRSGGFRISGTNGGNVVACAPPLPTVSAMYCLPLTM